MWSKSKIWSNIENLVKIDSRKSQFWDKKIVKKSIIGVEGVIHLAASGSVVESVKYPVDNFDNNVFSNMWRKF